jgi:FG-GAP-like repeat/Secretion system C-terminal sorting domain
LGIFGIRKNWIMRKILLLITVMFLFENNFISAQVAPFCFNSSVAYGIGLTYAFGITSGDFNEDGIEDLSVVNTGGGGVSIILGAGGGSFGPPLFFYLGTGPTRIIKNDFNGDGHLDLATSNSRNDSNSVSVLIGLGTGSFTAITNYSFNIGPHMALTSGDFNNDNIVDIAVPSLGTNEISVALGSGLGTFGTPVSFPVNYGPRSIITADFNLDGNLDLITTSSGLNTVGILLGIGTGSFLPQVNYNVGTLPQSVTSGDFNGDGKLDLATINYLSADVSILLGTGLGTFGSASSYSAQPGSFSIIANDLNGDAILDLIVSDYSRSSITVYLGLGNGTFNSGINYTISGGTMPIDLTAHDFNGDGRVDIAVSNGFSNNVFVFLNDIPPVISVNSGTICSGSSFTINATGANTYTYSGGSQIVSPTISSSYSVTGTTINGCIITNNAVSNISVTPSPIISISSSNSLICVGELSILIASGAQSYLWNTMAINDTIVVSPSLTSTYSVVGNGMYGCSNTSSIKIIVNPCTQVNELTNNYMTINPNPTNGLLIINSKTELQKIEVISIDGKIVLSENPTNEFHTLHLDNLAESIYFVNVYQNNRVVKREKIVLNKN